MAQLRIGRVIAKKMAFFFINFWFLEKFNIFWKNHLLEKYHFNRIIILAKFFLQIYEL